jgi:hypothetical protein
MVARPEGAQKGHRPEGGCYDIRRKLLADGGLSIKNGVLGILARGARIFGAVLAYGPTDYRKR